MVDNKLFHPEICTKTSEIKIWIVLETYINFLRSYTFDLYLLFFPRIQLNFYQRVKVNICQITWICWTL